MRYLLCFIFIISSGLTALSAQEQEYIWPTDASPYLTSTFGETRSAHFHSGLDIKTWGREGYKVFASKDGIVYRFGVSVEGYGKVIYLKHNDDTYTVYAHLQRFNKTFQALVDSVRMKDFAFEIDLLVDSLGIEVKQGDVIGYTGSTGVGPPHLHFETRDSNFEPFNSLLTNLSVADTIAPTISAMMVFPLTEQSKVRESRFPQVYYPSKSPGGSLNFDVIQSNGPIGIAISTFDEADGVENKYAVYELTMLHQSDTLFHQVLNEFTFNESETMFLDRLTAFNASRRSYQTLFKKDGPPIPFYEIVDDRTQINPGDSLAIFTIIAKDYYGNETVASVKVEGQAEDISTENLFINTPMYSWYWTEDWAVLGGTNTINFEKPEFGVTWDDKLNQHLLISENQHVLFSRFQPDQRYSFSTPDKDLTVKFQQQTFFDTLTVAASSYVVDDRVHVSIYPASIPARKDFEIQYFLGSGFEEGKNYRLFRFDRLRDKLNYVDSKLVGKTIHATPSELGEFLIIADDEPPILETPVLITTSYKKSFIHIKATDSLSGIDFKNTEILVNGIRGIVEYDNEEDLLIYYHPSFIPEKTNSVDIKVVDKAGNYSLRSFQI